MGRLHRERRLRFEPSPMDGVKAAPKKPVPPPIQVVTQQGEEVGDFPPLPVTTDRARVMERGAGREAIYWFNDGPDWLYFGGAEVTVNSGIPLPPGEGMTQKLAPNAEHYAVSAGTSTLRRVVVR